ncbi:Chorismate binding-like protein [Thermocrinis albus DSM 14484]|uniref:Chorismate binding-like protein n=1 Tax=Thermocrinis albus (strain DSM 14484 / JCM 11386 / HI 11/12) TaxID=638303 RepID=D3SPK0_THEAH|nr:anthranilate synthase component I family protein [Thermocrinis albus]ADC89087.1 Chorismate binding-like protein [Thermocrinis albus DSM 14484]
MRLILSGGFLEKRGLWEAIPGRLLFLQSIEEIPNRRGFLIISYGVLEETLGIKVKKGPYPPIIFVEIEDIKTFHPQEANYRLTLEGMSLKKDHYIKKVRRIKNLIEEGTLYQINLSVRFDMSLEGSRLGMFLQYYMRQEVPFAFFLDIGELFVVSGSMELFLKRRGEYLWSSPIKGTAGSPYQLLKSEKDKAENLMITDMVRNDMSMVAQPGSVEVEELFAVREYATLCQMHSTVRATTHRDSREVLLALFPPASVTGAPKRKAVEIIDQLEPHARDYYCGAAGVWDGQDMTLSVLIRTAFGMRNQVHYFAGSGIVYDSDPEGEWEETLSKLRAFYNNPL